MAIMLTAFVTLTGAIEYSASNKDIDIVYGEFTGYRFYGPSAPHVEIDTSKIAAVKFYIKCPNLESIEDAMVEIAYNSGTTGWVDEEHDLNDGLILTMDVPGVVEGDFFDAAVGTWNSEIIGTFSVEVLDSDGEVLGIGVYSQQSTPQITQPQEEHTTEPPPHTTEPPSSLTQVAAVTQAATPGSAAKTGSANIITASAMTVLSALAIMSMRKKSRQKEE